MAEMAKTRKRAPAMRESLASPRRPRKADAASPQMEGAPPREEFLQPQDQYFNFMDEEYVTMQNEAMSGGGLPVPFPSVLCKNVDEGDLVYLTWIQQEAEPVARAGLEVEVGRGKGGEKEGVDAEVDAEPKKIRANVYLAECIFTSSTSKQIRVHYTDPDHFNGGAQECQFVEDFGFAERVYMVRKGAKAEALSDASGSEASGASTPIDKAKSVVESHPVFAERGADGGVDWLNRATALAKATLRALERVTREEHASLAEGHAEGKQPEVTEKVSTMVGDMVTSQRQALVDTANGAKVSIGMQSKNVSIVLWAVAQMPAPTLAEAQNGTELVSQIGAMVKRQLAECMIAQKKQTEELIQLAMSGVIKQKATAAVPAAVKTRGFAADNPGGGVCAFHVLAAVQQLAKDPSLEKVEYSQERVNEVKQVIIENAYTRRDELVAAVTGEGHASLKGKSVSEVVEERMLEDLGEPLGEFVANVANGKGTKGWGGFQAVSLWSKDTPTRIVILDARSFESNYEVLCPGEMDKTQVAYAIWTGSHYKLGITVTGEEQKAIFKIGAGVGESEKAVGFITEFLKPHGSGAKGCSDLVGEERSAMIKKMVEGGGRIPAVKLGKKPPTKVTQAGKRGGGDQQQGGQQWGGGQQGGKRSERKRKRAEARAQPLNPAPAPPPKPKTAARVAVPRRTPVLVVNTRASVSDFLSGLTSKNKALRKLVDGATAYVGTHPQMILYAYPENEAELRASLGKFRSEGLTVRAYEQRRPDGRAVTPKKLLCEYNWKGLECPLGTKCTRYHSKER